MPADAPQPIVARRQVNTGTGYSSERGQSRDLLALIALTVLAAQHTEAEVFSAACCS